MGKNNKIRIGIDLGGTKIEAIALDPSGTMLARQRTATPRGDYQATLDAVDALVRALEEQTGQRGSVGIGIPGAISPATGLVKNANSTWLIGKPFDRDLEERLNRPVRLANDANCFALSEAVDGAGAGAEAVFGVILGTGCGGGIVVGGRCLTGPNAIAGEWGHNPLPWPRADEYPGPDCYCGKRGCIETWVSGPALAAAYGDPELSAEDIILRVRAGEIEAQSVFDLYLDRLARALAGVVNILDPDVIVLGGGLSNIDELYGRLPPLVSGFVFSDHFATPIRRNRHGDSGGGRGAAWLWPVQ